MYGLFVEIALLVAMTHGLLALGRIVGPRRCGLVLGLPSSTALMLLYCGYEHGVGEAMAAAESCLLGSVAAAALPLAYARVVRDASRRPWAPASAVAGYVAVASVSRLLPDAGALARVGFSTAGVLAACSLAGRMRIAGGGPRPGNEAWLRSRALGTLVPAALIVMVRGVRAVGGANWAGLFTTFPGMALALLVATHLEAGPAATCRMAKAMPHGNLVTLAFLAAFRFAGPRTGLGLGTACGYALALATLLTLEALTRSWSTAARPPGRATPRIVVAPTGHRPFATRLAQARFSRGSGCPAPFYGRRQNQRHRHRHPQRRRRRFLPRIESLPEDRGWLCES